MEINGLSKSYNGTTVLDIDHLSIKTGRFYAIVGENGAGKTTLFRILAGLTPPTGGTVTFSENNESIGVMIERTAVELLKRIFYGHQNYTAKISARKLMKSWRW